MKRDGDAMRRVGFGAACRRALVCGAALVLTGGISAEAVRPTIELDDILAMENVVGGRTTWGQAGDSLWLIERASEPGHLVLREQGLNGTPRKAWRPARQISVAPSGRAVLFRDEAGWEMHDLAADRRLAHVGADGAIGQVLAGGEIGWSQDEGFLVVLARGNEPPPARTGEASAVAVTDVGEAFEARRPRPFAIFSAVARDLAGEPRTWRVPGAVLGWQMNAEAIYLSRYHNGATGERVPHTVVERLDLHSGERRVLFRLDGLHQQTAPKLSPDGRWLAVLCDIDDRKWDDFVSVVAIDTRSGELRRLTRELYATAAAWLPDGRNLVVLARDRGWTQLHRVGIDGTTKALTDSASVKSAGLVSRDGAKVAFRMQDGYGRRQLCWLPAEGGEERVVETLADPPARFRLGRFERVTFPAPDGLSIGAFMVYPPDFDPARKYAAYVDVHGGGPGSPLFLSGPLTAGVNQGPLEWHAWAARGYVVFVPDYRSSGEYGPGVAAARYAAGDANGFEGDIRDVESGVRWLIAQPFVDATRVAIMGHSAGGARVNLLLTRSSLFRAAVVSEPIQSGTFAYLLPALTGANAGNDRWEERFVQTLGHRLADRPELYREHFLIDGFRSRTPTLIIAGGDRARGASDPLSAEMLFSVLRQSGVPTRLLRYEKEGHVLTDPAAVRHAFQQIETWLADHLKREREDDGRIRPAAEPDAMARFEEIRAARAVLDAIEPPSADATTAEVKALLERRDGLAQAFAEKGAAFLERFAEEPGRWQVIVWLQRHPPDFIRGWQPGAEAAEPRSVRRLAVRDEAARDAWRKRLETWLDEFLAAAEVPGELEEIRGQYRFGRARNEAIVALRAGGGPEIAALRRELQPLLEHGRDERVVAQAVKEFLDYVQVKGAAADVAAAETEFAEHRMSAVREVVERRRAANRQPVELAFTALDGRPVDLRDYRGKVVLLDFWATWCRPCVAEMPRVQRLYETYQARGFEIVGISLDRRRDEGKLRQFLAERGISWPQHFHGDSTGHPVATRFGVTALPHMLLLDREGRIAEPLVHAEQLEEVLLRLLEGDRRR